MIDSSFNTKDKYPHIRSFVRRTGRITNGQKKAWQELWRLYGLTWENKLLDLDNFFKDNNSPRILEIGFGDGASLLEMAANQPNSKFIGIEVHTPGIGKLLARLKEQNISNIMIICADATEVINNGFLNETFDKIQIFFPDPWPKTSHHKRRIVQDCFIKKLYNILRVNGKIHLATDWKEYAEHMLVVLKKQQSLQNIATNDLYVKRPSYRPVTKFEKRAKQLEYDIFDIIFQKIR